MPNYFYTAKSSTDETKTGNVVARDLHELAQILKQQEMFLINAVAEEKKKLSLNMNIDFSFGKISDAEKIMMAKSLWIMVGAGLSLVKSFEILTRQTKNKTLKKAFVDIKEMISKGKAVSESLEKYPKIFSDFFVNMVKVGEESGTLSQIFETLYAHLEKEHELKSKIKGAMIYPSIILIAIIALGSVVVTMFLPGLVNLFEALNVKVPFYTQIILNLGSFSAKYWPFILLAVFLGIPACFALLRTKQGKALVDTLLLRLPVLSEIVKKNNCAFLTGSLNSLLTAGVSLAKSLEITSGVLGNHYFRNALLEAVEKIKKGEKLSSALMPHEDIFPFGVIEMMDVGEETGQTSVILNKLSDFYRKEASLALDGLSAVIEPALIILLGGLVGFFAIAVLEPMYSVIKSI